MKLAVLILALSLAGGCSDSGIQQTETEGTTGESDSKIYNTNKQKLKAETSEQVNTEYEQPDAEEADDNENNPPVIKSIKIETVSNDPRDGFRAEIISEDPEGGEVDYMYQWKLNGEDLYGETGEFLEWKNEFGKGDRLSIEVIPFDDEAEGVWKSEGSFTIPNAPPVIKSSPEGAVSGNNFSYKVIAEDPDGDPVTLTLQNAPEGMELDPETGEITWTFSGDDSGSYNIDITATDSDGAYTVQNVSFTISGRE